MAENKIPTANEKFLSLLLKLGVADNFGRNQLKREDIYAIQIENQEENLRPIKFLRQLLSLDYHCRNTTYHETNDSNTNDDDSYDSEEDLFSNHTIREIAVSTPSCHEGISSSDLILCTLAVCDNFLIQDAFEKMISCQLAVPLIAPIGDQLVFHLWATRTIRKKWVKTMPDESQKTLEGIITNKELNTISFCRIGEIKTSKSKLANTFLSSAQGWPEHSYFIHRDIYSKPEFTGGSIEAIWYCPDGRDREKLKDVAMIYNLRGDVRKNAKQLEFLLKVSSVIVILMETNDMTSTEVETLNRAANCHKILVDFSRSGNSKTKGNKTIICAAGMNFQALSEAISKCNGCINDYKLSLEAHAEIAQELAIKVDENEDSNCLHAKNSAKKFMENIKSYQTEILRKKLYHCKESYGKNGQNLTKKRPDISSGEPLILKSIVIV